MVSLINQNSQTQSFESNGSIQVLIDNKSKLSLLFNNTIYKEEEKYSKKNKTYNQKYRKLRKLGSGAYGIVYLVRDTQLNSVFAMKKYFFDPIKNNPKLIDNQISLLSELTSNSFPFIFDSFQQDFNKYVISDYFHVNLIDLLKQFPFKSNESIYQNIIYLIIHAVFQMHDKHIIHRDLKPENIMLCNDGSVKIIDFDLAIKLEDEQQELAKGVATLYYKPAEIFFGERKYGYNLDLWSLGCISAEIYLGYPLFCEENEIGVLSKITDLLGAPSEENYPGVSKLETFMPFISSETTLFEETFADCPLSLKQLIKSLLSLNPSKRPSCSVLLNEQPYLKDLDIMSCQKNIYQAINK